jgi:hypothetical protein
MMLNTYPLLVPKLRKRGTIPPVPPSTFMVCGGSTLLFSHPKENEIGRACSMHDIYLHTKFYWKTLRK